MYRLHDFYPEDADKTNLGGNLGLIYGSIAFFTFFALMFSVGTKNIEHEEMDEKFGATARITTLEDKIEEDRTSAVEVIRLKSKTKKAI